MLHHFLDALLHVESPREPESYVEEMGYNYGSAGEEVARGVLKTRTWIWEHEPLRYPLNKRATRSCPCWVDSTFGIGILARSANRIPICSITKIKHAITD